MVACHNFDLNAAKSVGFKTAFVRRPLEWGPAGPPDPEPNPRHDIIVDDFNHLGSRARHFVTAAICDRVTVGPPRPHQRDATMNCLSKRLTYLLISRSLSLHGLVAAEPESVDLNFGPDLPSAGWQIVSFPFISALTFKVVDTTTVEIVADAAAGMAWHTVSESGSSVVSAAWGWRAMMGLAAPI